MKTKLTTTKTLISLAVLAASVNVQADELETITVTATRTAQDLTSSLASINVIDRADIEAIKPLSTLELLSTVAGLDVSQQGGRGQSASIFMRGTNANHTLVLVDGIRISSATLGTSDLQSIAPSQIERIEIVKGPRAAIWGSDAIGGVIQIFTRNAQGVTLNASIGSEGYKGLTATMGIAHGDGQSTISVSREEADGFDVLADVEPDKDGFEHTTFTATGEQNVSEQLQLTYLLQKNKGDNQYDNRFGGNNQVESDNYAWNLGANYKWSDTDELSVKVGQNQDSRLNYKAGESSDSLFETNRDQVSVVNNSQLNSATALTYGFDYINESITTTVNQFSPAYNEDERKVLGAFAYGQHQIEQFTLEAAVRYDDVEDIDSEVTYNLGLGYDLTPSTKLAVNHSTGFKAPTFNDLYYPFGGNPNLESETSDTTEVLLKKGLDNGAFGISLYRTDVENLIAWAPLPSGAWSPQNVNEAEIQGAEFELNYTFAGLTHDLSLAYIDTEDGKGKRLIRRARDHFNYSVTAQLGEIDFSVSYSYKGDRLDSNDVKLGSYSLVNAKLGYSVSESLRLDFKVNNLFDETYSTANGYNAQEQSFYFGVTYKN